MMDGSLLVISPNDRANQATGSIKIPRWRLVATPLPPGLP
jgi:hypothetical protein